MIGDTTMNKTDSILAAWQLPVVNQIHLMRGKAGE